MGPLRTLASIGGRSEELKAEAGAKAKADKTKK
jgi:hypothetical protein